MQNSHPSTGGYFRVYLLSAVNQEDFSYKNNTKLHFICEICKKITKTTTFFEKYLHDWKISSNFAKILQISDLKLKSYTILIQQKQETKY